MSERKTDLNSQQLNIKDSGCASINRVHNFFPGPGALPLECILSCQNEMADFRGTGMSILETSHRTPQYEQVHNGSLELVRELLKVPDNYHIMWLQAGASMQFAMLPMGLLSGGKSADFVLTGHWSQKAVTEARIVGKAHVAGSSEDNGYTYIPKKLDLDENAQYVHITSNNTIFGTQYFEYPDTGDIPLVADMSSDIMWRPIDVSKFAVIYAGAHKNLGPSGATMVIMREDILEKCDRNLPTMLQYKTHVDNNSMYNTPPTFTIFFVYNVLQGIKEFGGLEAMEKKNRRKGEIFYGFVDNCGGFYNCDIQKEDRSIMNAVFSLPSVELEDKFVAEAIENGLIGLKNLPFRGHCRVSMYNSTSVESVQALVEFMKDFMDANG